MPERQAMSSSTPSNGSPSSSASHAAYFLGAGTVEDEPFDIVDLLSSTDLERLTHHAR
ncbi:hypothetical protein VN12_06700 [Pirellula sp. SH-Sr6A]|nr:hypothetical protein VN12_06700 [Pirellula sp. SH-Sr6A]